MYICKNEGGNATELTNRAINGEIKLLFQLSKMLIKGRQRKMSIVVEEGTDVRV